jgi:hypothetical protein
MMIQRILSDPYDLIGSAYQGEIDERKPGFK